MNDLYTYVYSSNGKLFKAGNKKFRAIPIEFYTVNETDFDTNNAQGYQLIGLNTDKTAIRIPSHIDSRKVASLVRDGSNEHTKYISFTDETDFNLTYEAASGTLSRQSALKSVTNIPQGLHNLRLHAPVLEQVSDASNLTSFELSENTTMKTLSGVTGLSDSENLTSLTLKKNTGLEDLSEFIIPAGLTSLKTLFQNCTSLEKVRIDYNYTPEIKSNCGQMFQYTALKRLDIYASDFYTLSPFNGDFFEHGAVEIRCTPNTNTWDNWKSYIEANSSPFSSNYVGTCHFCVHSFDQNPKSIVVWGDSLVRGGDGTTYSDLCVYLSNMLSNDAIVQNQGKGGITPQQMLPYFNNYDVGWNDINVLFLGHNNANNLISIYNESFIPRLTKYIVLGLVTKSYSSSLNEQMAEEYGSLYIDTHNYLIQRGFQITGLTPTAQDEQDIAAGNVPHSFLASDYIHLNLYGGLIVATAIKEKLLSLGYINNSWLAS